MGRGGGDKKTKRMGYFRQSHLLLGEAEILSGTSTEFQTDWFKIPLLGEAETAIGLGIKS